MDYTRSFQTDVWADARQQLDNTLARLQKTIANGGLRVLRKRFPERVICVFLLGGTHGLAEQLEKRLQVMGFSAVVHEVGDEAAYRELSLGVSPDAVVCACSGADPLANFIAMEDPNVTWVRLQNPPSEMGISLAAEEVETGTTRRIVQALHVRRRS